MKRERLNLETARKLSGIAGMRARRLVDGMLEIDRLSDEEFDHKLSDEILRDPWTKCLNFLQEEQSHRPWAHGCEVPDEGVWILAKHVPVVGFPSGKSWQVPPLSIWFALPEWRGSSRMRGMAYRHLARIITPEGEMCLESHEFVVMQGGLSNLLQVDDGSQVKINYLSGDAVIPEDKLFYMQSRGIPLSKAVLMLVDHVRSQHWCWFSLPSEYAELLGVDRPPRAFVGRGLPAIEEIEYA